METCRYIARKAIDDEHEDEPEQEEISDDSETSTSAVSEEQLQEEYRRVSRTLVLSFQALNQLPDEED